MIEEHGLGRNPSPYDARDWLPETLISMVRLGLAAPITWRVPVQLHQRNTPHCVGFSGAHFMSAAGSKAGATTEGITDALGHALYYECKVEDGEPRAENGSNLRSLAKVLKKRGVIDAYALTRSVDDIHRWMKHGIVILGIPWYEDMFTKDANRVIHPGGVLRGGHAICQYAAGQTFDNGLWNSWGEWGSCWLLDEDLRLLMNQWGEALLTVRTGGPLRLPWELESLIADGSIEVSADDRVSIIAAYNAGAMRGYPDDTFRPQPRPGQDLGDMYGRLTEHQVRTVLGNLHLPVPGPTRGEWDRPARRGWVRDHFPGLAWYEERWDEALTRYQLLLLVGRYIRDLAQTQEAEGVIV